MSVERRDYIEGMTIIAVVIAISIALWLLSGATHSIPA